VNTDTHHFSADAANSAHSAVPIRILIVDDHAAMREGMRAMIANQPEMTVVAEAANGQAAIELYRQYQPDITLMDMSLPIISGVEAIGKIRVDYPNARIIVVTTFDDDELLFNAFDVGFEGFLLKDMLRKELLPAIRTVHNGQRYIPSVIASRLSKRL
jgi:two-component system NarL family response regulator